MKKYNALIGASVLFYGVLSLLLGVLLLHREQEQGQFYKVEINRILAEIETPEDIETIDLTPYGNIRAVSYLPAAEQERSVAEAFYQGENGRESMIYPLFAGENMEGWLRFDYEKNASAFRTFFLAEGALVLSGLFLLAVLFYLRGQLIKPFHRMQAMTYELSKGNLQGEIKEEKSRYFGKFLWGIGELKDALYVSRKRELELQKEKKLLLLSLSHDIKTPLNMIKLYGKALEDGIYATNAEQQKVYRQIGEKADQIENYVGEILKASREDILHIEVEQGEFYIKDVLGRVERVYREKCAIRKCSFIIGEVANRLFRGDANRLFEVFENIFENAFKYGDGRRIEITFYEEEYCQLIRVFNTGEPVTEKEFVHLFDSFFRGENTRGQQGNGLGLYICREIMNRMGGEIFAEREEDGMAFVVVLPLWQPEE